MKCPHCSVSVHVKALTHYLDKDEDGHFFVKAHKCPACQRRVLSLIPHYSPRTC